MSIITLDIETIPTEDMRVIERIAEGVTHPKSMKKAETIEKWEAEKKQFEVGEAVAKTSFNGGYGQIVCIGWAIDDLPAQTATGDEKSIIEGFFTDFNRAFSPARSYKPTIIGFNHIAFDLRFIYQRAVVLGIKPPALLSFDARPWDQNVYDVMSKWAGYGGSIKLDELAFILGIEGKSMSGADVYPLYKDGKLDVISDYCADDVNLTRAIYKRMTFMGL